MRNIRNLKDPTAWIWTLLILPLLDSAEANAELTKVSCNSGGGTTITCDCNNYDQVNHLLERNYSKLIEFEIKEKLQENIH